MLRMRGLTFFALFAALFVSFTLVSTDFAEARRGGSFGSRGSRTFQAPPPTRTAPAQTAPVERSMTPAPAPGATRQQQTGAQQAAGPQRPGMFGGGLGGSLMRGILIGGLFGMLLGYGFGGMAGALGFLIQLLLVGALIWLAMAFFRSRRTPAMAGGAPSGGHGFGREPTRRDAAPSGDTRRAGGFTVPSIGGGAAAQVESEPEIEHIRLDQADLDTFQQRLTEVQEAFSREDHAALRRLSTPEMVSFFSEELAQNATRGVVNAVSGVHLLQADIAEAWREHDRDYATAALRYEAVDVLRDRATGALAGGSEEPSETVELWTFVRERGGAWKLSAIQEA
ncbi:Tim44 domain-containing protein [Aquibium microcysteis]|uniref:Tim44 domain-containing protein n=1 Tax=Aquibium microcysteis TaxID=675281 RepID=UPI001EF19247|nr:Tim44 domain-containing protein [Aquibium microcysteis]